MMDVTVVYESLFGNTQAIAEAIAAGARQAHPGASVRLIPISGQEGRVMATASRPPAHVVESSIVIAAPRRRSSITSPMCGASRSGTPCQD